MSADKRDLRQDKDDDGVSEEAGAIEGFGFQPGAEDEKSASQEQPADPPEELEEERRG